MGADWNWLSSRYADSRLDLVGYDPEVDAVASVCRVRLTGLANANNRWVHPAGNSGDTTKSHDASKGESHERGRYETRLARRSKA
jgi:hypothetical protein